MPAIPRDQRDLYVEAMIENLDEVIDYFCPPNVDDVALQKKEVL
jgi:hypothetical protein